MRPIDADSMKADLLTVDPRYERMIQWCITVLDAQPTIERKTGKWYKPNGVMPPEHFGRHRCSICDAFAMHDWKHHREQLTDYCPNCGAEMKGEQE